MSTRQRAAGAFLRLPPSTRRAVLHRLGRYAPWEPEFDFTPPRPAPGYVPGPPDFVGIGAQKAGTTWWFDLIATHPGVTTPVGLHKERHLLDRYASRSFDRRAIEGIHAWFPRRPGTITGEWPPDYCTFAWAPELLRRAAPDARVLMLVRDPVDRFLSGVAHYATRGTPVDGLVLADAFRRGCYASLLEPWLHAYGRDRVLVLQYEQCTDDADRWLAETFAFLGLSEYHPSEAEQPRRPAPTPRDVLEDDARERLVALYEPDVAELAALVPTLDLKRWPGFGHLARPSSQLPGSADRVVPVPSGVVSSPTERP